MHHRSAIARGRRLQAAIMARGGPPAARRAQYHQAVAILNAAERGDGLGFFPALLPAMGWALAILGSIAAAFVVVPIVQEARGVVRESGEAARGLVSLSKWLLGAGVALWVWRGHQRASA